MKTIIALAAALICGHIASAQTVINQGGIYQNGFYNAPNRGTPAIVLATTEPVVFQNATFFGNVCIFANPGANITLVNCMLYGGYYKKAALIRAPGAWQISYQNCFFFTEAGKIVSQDYH